MRWLLILCGLLLPHVLWSAEPTSQEVRLVEAIHAALAEAGKSYAAGDYRQSAQHITEAMAGIREATQDGPAELYDQLLPTINRIEKAHTMLEFEGVSIAPFKRPVRPQPTRSQMEGRKGDAKAEPSSEPSTPSSPLTATGSKPAARSSAPAARSPNRSRPDRRMPVPPNSPASNAVSFTSAVTPILVSRCGSCHISASRGGFSAASFSVLMKGPPEGVVVFAGDTVGSRLIESIETGDMPRGGGKVTPQELQTLKAWIMAGAKFDGTDPDSPLVPGVTPAPATPAPVTGGVDVRRASGTETVSFAADVAPLLVDNCKGCHIDATQTRGGLRLDTFAQLLRGGDTGALVVPGKGAESLLVQRLRGNMGDRMPAGGRPPLSEESIELISTWIDEGATLDGVSESQPLGVMSQLAWAAAATPEELSQRRAELAAARLKLVVPSAQSISSHSSEHFMVTGPVARGTLEMVARTAEAQMKTVKSVIKSGGGQGFYRGRATIYVFPKRYDYSEFAKMTEGRSIPANWNSHWSFDGVSAYVALVSSDQESSETVESRLAAPLVSLAVATRGRDVPHWFAEGTGAATAYRVAAARDREARRRQEAEISAALAAMQSAKEFLEGKLSPEQTDRIGTAIASSLLDRTLRRGFDSLVRLLDDGRSFDQAFRESFRMTPDAFIEAWINQIRRG